MCRLRNIAMRDYKESVPTGQTEYAAMLRRLHKNEIACLQIINLEELRTLRNRLNTYVYTRILVC